MGISEAIIDVRVRELRQLFNSLDATPFPETDLDADAEDFIMTWAMEFASNAPIRIRIHLDNYEALDDNAAVQSQEAMQNFFDYRADVTRRRFHRLMRRGRVSLLIGLGCLSVTVLIANLIDTLEDAPYLRIIRESLIIGGWVAMWGPLNIFLYDWWPLRNERSVCMRLAKAQVEIVPLHSRNIPSPPEATEANLKASIWL